MFVSILDLESDDNLSFNIRMESLKSQGEPFGLFMDFYNRRKKNKSAQLVCLNDDDLTPAPEEELGPPMAKSYIPFPDLVEVYIAEIMLGRELTHNEKDGSRFIPKINEQGEHYFAPLTWVTFPHSYISVKDMEDHTDYDAEPLPKVFDIDVIRDMYKGRKGDVVDE